MKNTAEIPSSREAFDRLCELVRDINIAMMTTVAPDGALRSRPMGTQQFDPANTALWFFTASDSPKVREITEDHAVGLTYACPEKQKYVSISGRARLVYDPEKARELWTPIAKAWFPQGVDDPHLMLLRVQVTAAEYWDSPSSRMVQLFGLAQAAMGHPTKALGRNVKVDLGGAETGAS